VFQPGALFRLLGIPHHLLTNQLVEAEDVIGKTDSLFYTDDVKLKNGKILLG
jgi:hypothetical protein